MKRKKKKKLAVRLPMPPPGKPHGSKKGDKGYFRPREKQRQSQDRDVTGS